jgi:membrane-associated phospholipid phosphatase
VGVAVTQIVTLPGQVVVSFVLVALGAWKLRKPWWVIAWLAATLVEFAIRHFMTRPELYRGGVHVTAFDSSFPSGHALRCALVAAVFAAAWPRLRVPLAAWVVACAVLLELAGFHTPTDVVGGLLLAGLAARALRHP